MSDRAQSGSDVADSREQPSHKAPSAVADRFVGPGEAEPEHPGLVLGPPPNATVREIVGYRRAPTFSDERRASRGLAVETSEGIVGPTRTGPGTNGTNVAD